MAQDAVSSSPLQGSVDRIRASARWLLGAFGAIGVALAVGAQFSNLGKLEGGARDWALVGVGLTFGGIGVALFAGARVLAPRPPFLKDIAARERRGRRWFQLPDPALKLFGSAPELLSPFANVNELWTQRTSVLDEYAEKYADWYEAPTDDRWTAVEKVVEHAKIVEEAAQQALSWADFSRIRAAYTRGLVCGVIPGIVAAGVGLTIFALKIPDVPPTAPTPAEVRLEGVDLRHLNLHDVTLHGADLKDADLASANLAGADLSDAMLSGADLAGADLSKANLARASLKGANVANVTWKSTTCPDGRRSSDVGGSCEAHLIPASR